MLGFKIISKVRPTRYVHGLDVGWEEKRGSVMTPKVLTLSTTMRKLPGGKSGKEMKNSVFVNEE